MQIRVPPLGESITEATISRWLKREGEAVNIGDTLVELETDKITVEVPAAKGGVLGKRAKLEGDVVKVDEVLGEILEGEVGAQGQATADGGRQTADSAAPAPAAPAPAAPAPAPLPADVRAAPSAVRLAIESGMDLAAVSGTGRGGVVSKPDVWAAMQAGRQTAERPTADGRRQTAEVQAPVTAPAAATVAAATSSAVSRPPSAVSPVAPVAPAAGVRETREKMTTRRKRIAENLLQAQHATAHLTTFNEIDMSALSALRERMKERVEKEHGLKLSFMPFFAKAACMALKAFPTVNAQVDGDAILYKHYVNLGIAVASDAGLVVPNVKDADRHSILDLQRDIAALAKTARDGKLTMDDLTGGSFTITNGGVFGSLISTPIINFPQVAILGLHKTQDRPVAVNGQVVIRPMMYVALSYDHRVIDGQQAVLFLVKLKELLEDPATMLID
ncbi:MAG: 2-oxoglutarate dehydrogenase complex dihydrolipoyllysine-residue succinyltransferase [Gemmatimonadaceae bacterium]|nr:2-oxoglutarate dehydrogenase complex dihydrolipoyllysine-residue succinyltransferase [Gemmatimonadaceae bacterium]